MMETQFCLGHGAAGKEMNRCLVPVKLTKRKLIQCLVIGGGGGGGELKEMKHIFLNIWGL